MGKSARLVSLVFALVFGGLSAAAALRGNDETVDVAASSATSDSKEPAESPEPADTDKDEAAIAAEPPEYLINDGPAPTELVEIEAWYQTDARSLAEVRGEVTIVKFWTFGCFNCKNTVPHFQDLYAKYSGDGLEIVGVHAYEFERERDLDNIQQAVLDQGITWPIAVDNTKKNFRSWQKSRRFWPRYFVIDQNGDIRYDKIGEGRYERLDEIVGYLLENPPEPPT